MGELKGYKVFFPEKGVFVSDDHNWAFAAWEICRLQKYINNATLVHVDAHLDDTWDGILVEGLHDIKSIEEVYKVTEKLDVANFIWAGFSTDAINNIIYVTRKTDRFQKHNPFDFNEWDFDDHELVEIKKLIQKKKYEGARFESIEELYAMKGEITKFTKDKPIILDLDLDYFNKSDSFEKNLMEDHFIRESLYQIRDMYEWDLITVALSPIYCGGDDAAWHIYEIFLEVFELKLADAKVW